MHIKDNSQAQGWFRRHAAAPSSIGSWKAFVARNKTVQEPRTMAKAGGLMEEYYGKDKLDWMENHKDQMSFEEYLRWKRSGSFSDGGIIGKPGGLVEPGVEYYGNVKTLTATHERRIAKYNEWAKKNKKPLYESSKTPGWKKYDVREGNWTGKGSGEKFKDPKWVAIRDKDKQIVKVRDYLSKAYRENKYKPLTFSTIADIKKKSKVTGNIDADITRALQSDKFKNKINLRGFDKLPDEVIAEIKTRFNDIIPKDKWNFDKYKFGVNKTQFTEKVYDRIRALVQDPTPTRYGFGFNNAEGWMVAQMDRAWRSGNKDYKPIYKDIRGNRRVVGYIDNTEKGGGKKWFVSDEHIKGKNSDGLLLKGTDKYKAHADFAENVKFHNIVKNAGQQPNKAITEILKTGGIDQKVQLRHVMNYILDNTDASAARNSIVRHHRGQLKNATSDLQILNRVQNAKVIGIEQRIANNEILPKDVAKLKKWGVSVRGPDGVLYGSGPTTAEGGMKKINKLILKGSTDVDLYGKKIKGIEKWNKKDFTEFNKYLVKLGCGTYAGGRVGFKVGSGKCINRAVAKLKSGKLNSAEKKIVDAMGDGLKKGGMPKKFWTTALKGEGYFALADFANNLTKGQSLDKSFSNAVESVTFGALDIGGNERDLMRYAEERGLDTKDMKEWMDYAQTYGKYVEGHEDLAEREKIVEASGGEEEYWKNYSPNVILNPEGDTGGMDELWEAEKKIERAEKQLEEKGKSETIQSGKGYKDMNEMIEGVIAKEWNKFAGTPLDRGFRKMVGMKGDEGILWGIPGVLTREALEQAGFGEHDALKGFTPQTVMNYHPVYGYKEDMKDIIRQGDSPMEDMLMYMEKNYPGSGLIQEALREVAKEKEVEKWVDTGFGREKRKVKTDMGSYDYDPNLAEGGIASLNVKK